MTNTPFLIFAKSWVQSNGTKTSFGKFKASIISIVLGCLIAIIVMYLLNANGFAAFGEILSSSFEKVKLQRTLFIAGILVIASLANAVAFKSGLFNIGVSGQMFFSALIMVIFGTKVIQSWGYVGGFILVIIAMIVGALVSAFSGFLKAYFNIHEVISSILLNWGLFFLGKVIIKAIPDFNYDGTLEKGTLAIGDDMKLLNNSATSIINYGTIIFAGFAIVAALIIGFIFWKTRFGFNSKAVGINPNAASTMGVSKRKQVILSMAFSGLVAGLGAGLLFIYQDISANIPAEYIRSNDIAFLLPYGFDGIAVSLIAFNNPVAIIPVAVFFGALKNGSTILSNYSLEPEVYNLLIGLIMYFAAISVVFMRFRLFKMVYEYIKLQHVKTILQLRTKYYDDLRALRRGETQTAKAVGVTQSVIESANTKAVVPSHVKSQDFSLRQEFEMFFVKLRLLFKTLIKTLKAYWKECADYRGHLRLQKVKIVSSYERKFSKYDTLVRSEEYQELHTRFFSEHKARIFKSVSKGRAIGFFQTKIAQLVPFNKREKYAFNLEVSRLLEEVEE